MNNKIIVLAVAAVAVVMLNRAKAVRAPAGSASQAPPSKNMNGALWSAILGGGWKALTDAKNADGSMALLGTNGLGQIVTSDGKPVGQEYMDLYPAVYGGFLPVDTTADGKDYLSFLGFGNY